MILSDCNHPVLPSRVEWPFSFEATENVTLVTVCPVLFFMNTASGVLVSRHAGLSLSNVSSTCDSGDGELFSRQAEHASRAMPDSARTTPAFAPNNLGPPLGYSRYLRLVLRASLASITEA